MSGNYGYFHDLFFADDAHTAASCRLDLARPPRNPDGESVYMAASDAAGMLSTHLRRLSEVLHHAFDTDDPVPPSREAMRDIAWTTDELNGLLEVLRSIEEISRAAEKRSAADA